ncbi:ribonuclease H-like domain-containing protein [Tanacetum coccineum]
MVNCNPSRTPVDTDSKLGPDGVLVQDPTLYRSLAGGLQYLTFTRPECAYAVQRFVSMVACSLGGRILPLQRICALVQGTLDLGFHLYASATTSLVGYTDADWVGCPSTRRSNFGYCVFLGDNCCLGLLNDDTPISRSSAKQNIEVLTNVVLPRLLWIRQSPS